MTDKNIIPTESLNYKTYTKISSKLKYLKISMNNRAGGSFDLAAASSEQVEFKLPATCYNLSKSIISYNTAIPTGGAGKAQWAFNNSGLELAQSMTLSSANGQNLVDIQYLNNYLSIVRPLLTSDQDFKENDVSNGMNPVVDESTNYTGISITPPAGNVYSLPASAELSALTSGEPQYLKGVIALADPLTVSRSVMLGNVKGTMFEPDKVSYFGQELYIRFQTAPSSKFGFLSTSVTDPTAGASVLASQPSVNMTLYLAVETEPIIIASLQEKYLSGQLQYLVPFSTVIRNSTSAPAGRKSLSVNATSQYGRVLKRVIHSVFPASETLNSAFDHSNFNGSKITSFQTSLEAVPRQNEFMNCLQPSTASPTLTLDDWRENMQFLKGSVISNSASYQVNWCHVDSFCDISRDPEHPDSNVLAGLDLSTPKQWQITMDLTNADYSHYTILQLARTLAVVPGSGPVYTS